MAFALGECLLQDYLDKKGWTQSEFSRRMDCSRQYVNALVSGKEKMSLEFAINASYILECRITDLYVLEIVRSRKG